MEAQGAAEGEEQGFSELCEAISSLPDGCMHQIMRFYVALRSMHALSNEEHVNGGRAWRVCRAVGATSPLVWHFLDQLKYDVDFGDADLTEETWNWLTGLKLRRLGLQKQGLARLYCSIAPGPAWSQLGTLSVATGEVGLLDGVLPHLTALRHLEVYLQGVGTAFPRLPRRLSTLSIHCSNTASLHTLLPLCQADSVTVAAAESIVWNTSLQAGLEGLPWHKALLELAKGSGQLRGGAWGRLRLLVPSGFNKMFGSMELALALTSAGTLNCYAAAVARQLAPLQPVELTLKAGQAIRFQDSSDTLSHSSLNFSPTLARSAAVWEGLWEAAAELAGLELSSRFKAPPTLGEGGDAGGVLATVSKASPATIWPQPAAKQADAAGGGVAVEKGGKARWAARQKKRAGAGQVVLGLMQAGLLMAAGALLGRLLKAQRSG